MKDNHLKLKKLTFKIIQQPVILCRVFKNYDDLGALMMIPAVISQLIAKNLLAKASVSLRAFDSAQAPDYDLITGLEISPFQAAPLRFTALQSK